MRVLVDADGRPRAWTDSETAWNGRNVIKDAPKPPQPTNEHIWDEDAEEWTRITDSHRPLEGIGQLDEMPSKLRDGSLSAEEALARLIESGRI